MHCERTSFVTFGAFAVFLYLVYEAYVEDFTPEFLINNEPISYLLLAGLVTLFGYFGVLYYRVRKGKRPLFIIQFWKAT